MVTRRRLSPADRRRQLVEVGAELFASLPYENVFMEEVAERAGVSRALLYKHFPTKRDLFAAVYREAAQGMPAATGPDPGVPFTEQAVAALDRHFDHVAANREAVLAAHRTLAGDPAVQAIVAGELAVLRQRMIDASGLAGPEREVLAAVLTAWLVFVRVLVPDWLDGSALSRDRLRDTCVGALTGALGDLGPRIEQARAGRSV